MIYVLWTSLALFIICLVAWQIALNRWMKSIMNWQNSQDKYAIESSENFSNMHKAQMKLFENYQEQLKIIIKHVGLDTEKRD